MSVSSGLTTQPIGTVVFAAGRGKRIRPLSDVCPKAALPLLDVPQGRPALLTLAEIAPLAVVNLSHLADEATRLLGVGAIKGVETFVETPEPYGTAGTLRALLPRLATTVVTWNADLLTDLDPAELLASHHHLGRPATLAVKDVAAAADFARDGSRLTKLFDRRFGESGPGARFIGMAVFERDALERLPERKPLGLTEGLLRDLAAEGSLACHVHGGYARDVGTVRDYLAASFDLLNDRVRVTNFEPPGRFVAIEGGRAYFGPGAQVEESSLGPNAIVLADAPVSSNARIENAIVWRGERVPANVRVANGVWFGGSLYT